MPEARTSSESESSTTSYEDIDASTPGGDCPPAGATRPFGKFGQDEAIVRASPDEGKEKKEDGEEDEADMKPPSPDESTVESSAQLQAWIAELETSAMHNESMDLVDQSLYHTLGTILGLPSLAPIEDDEEQSEKLERTDSILEGLNESKDERIARMTSENDLPEVVERGRLRQEIEQKDDEIAKWKRLYEEKNNELENLNAKNEKGKSALKKFATELYEEKSNRSDNEEKTWDAIYNMVVVDVLATFLLFGFAACASQNIICYICSGIMTVKAGLCLLLWKKSEKLLGQCSFDKPSSKFDKFLDDRKPRDAMTTRANDAFGIFHNFNEIDDVTKISLSRGMRRGHENAAFGAANFETTSPQ